MAPTDWIQALGTPILVLVILWQSRDTKNLVKAAIAQAGNMSVLVTQIERAYLTMTERWKQEIIEALLVLYEAMAKLWHDGERWYNEDLAEVAVAHQFPNDDSFLLPPGIGPALARGNVEVVQAVWDATTTAKKARARLDRFLAIQAADEDRRSAGPLVAGEEDTFHREVTEVKEKAYYACRAIQVALKKMKLDVELRLEAHPGKPPTAFV